LDDFTGEGKIFCATERRKIGKKRGSQIKKGLFMGGEKKTRDLGGKKASLLTLRFRKYTRDQNSRDSRGAEHGGGGRKKYKRIWS